MNRTRMLLGLACVLLAGLAVASPAAARTARNTNKNGPQEVVKTTVPDMKQKASMGGTREREEAIRRLASLTKQQVRDFNIIEFLSRGFVDSNTTSVRLRRAALETIVEIATSVDTGLKNNALRIVLPLLSQPGTHKILRLEAIEQVHKLVDASRPIGDDRTAIQRLERMAINQTEDATIRAAALRSLGLAGSRTSNQAIRTCLSTNNDMVQAAALEALGYWLRNGNDLGQEQGLVTVLKNMLGDGDTTVRMRIAVVEILGQMDQGSAVGAVEKLVSEMQITPENPHALEQLLIQGIKTLQRFGRSSSIDVLVKTYKDFPTDKDVRIRRQVVSALGGFITTMGGGNATGARYVRQITDFLQGILDNEDENAEVRAEAAYALGELSINERLPRQDSVKVLIEYLQDDSESVRKQCKEALDLILFSPVYEAPGMTPEDLQKAYADWWSANKRRYR